MHLVQILLPLYDPEGRRFPRELNDGVRSELAERFGGLTAYVRSPAEGVWKEQGSAMEGDGKEGDHGGRTVHDDIAVYEVMVEQLDRDWWRGYREDLRRRFRQEDLVIRVHAIERL
jgi:hypothetical protein